jgi:GT2 family glycosyltransferase
MNELVSIIIVNFNGIKYLEKCLGSILKINYQNYEIIVIDNHSTDGSIDLIKQKYPQVKLVELEKNYGFAEPNNIAAKIAMGQYLHFLNNDTEVTPNFLDELIKTMKQDSDIAILQSMLLHPDDTVDSGGDYADTLGRAYSSKKRPEEIQSILSARGASMMVRKDIFWKLGGFDQEFFATFEDVDIGWRAWISGYKVAIVPKSIVYHIGGQTIKTINPLIQFHGVKNTLVLRLTNFEFSFSFKSIILLFFVSFMRKFFKISVVRDPEIAPKLPSFKILMKGVLWIIQNQNYIRKKRFNVKKSRILSTANLIERGIISKYSFE